MIGVYPMLVDETCWFLAVDFDKEEWKENSKAYLETCETFNVSAVLERSRSGKGGHIWIFFSEPIPAKLARQLGAFMLTRTMEARPEMGFRSYDQFFPSQDTLPRGGFGSLIALPVQAKPRKEGNSLFVDENLHPYSDQWSYLSVVQRMSFAEVQSVVDKAAYRGGVLGVRFVSTDEDDISPWLYSPRHWCTSGIDRIWENCSRSLFNCEAICKHFDPGSFKRTSPSVDRTIEYFSRCFS